MNIFKNEAASKRQILKQRQWSNYFAKNWAWISTLHI